MGSGIVLPKIVDTLPQLGLDGSQGDNQIDDHITPDVDKHWYRDALGIQHGLANEQRHQAQEHRPDHPRRDAAVIMTQPKPHGGQPDGLPRPYHLP
jgi:hypothetical protein